MQHAVDDQVRAMRGDALLALPRLGPQHRHAHDDVAGERNDVIVHEREDVRCVFLAPEQGVQRAALTGPDEAQRHAGVALERVQTPASERRGSRQPGRRHRELHGERKGGRGGRLPPYAGARHHRLASEPRSRSSSSFSYASMIFCTSGWRTTSTLVNRVKAMPRTPESTRAASISPLFCPRARSICVMSPVMTALVPKPMRVRNIFICSGVVFCASSRMMNE